MANKLEELKILEQKIEDEHNRLLSINNEQVRMLKLVESEKYEISELQGLKVNIKEELDTLKLNKKALEIEIANLHKEQEELVEGSADVRIEILNIKALIANELKLRDEKMTDLDVRKSLVENKEQEISDREKALVLGEIILKKNHEAIKELVAKLN